MNKLHFFPSTQPTGQWQTIYCSLMLLLVVFFVMLIAFSAVDNSRFLQMKDVTSMTPAIAPPSPDMNQAMLSMQQLGVNGETNNDFQVIRTQDGFKAIIPDPVLFPSGEATLGKQVYPILDSIIEIAKRDSLSIEVEGHTDNIPIHTQNFPSNWELSTMRAVNILRYLQQNGISPVRLAAIGFAEYRPVAGNDTSEGRQKNRRIEILFRAAR